MTESSGSSCNSSNQTGEIQLKSLIFRTTKIRWEIEKFAQVFSFDKLEEDYDFNDFLIREDDHRPCRSTKILSPLFTSLCGNVWQIEITGKEALGVPKDPRSHLIIKIYIRNKKTEGRCQYYISFTPSICYDDRYSENLKDRSKEIAIPTFVQKQGSSELLYGTRYIDFNNETPAAQNNPTGNVTLILRVQEEVNHVHRQLALVPDEASISNQLVDDISSLLDTGNFSDITLIVGKSKFKAHKNILSTRSPVFKTMFFSGMQEATSNVIKIKDLDADTVQRMLKYIYTGTLPNFQEPKIAEDLLYAAEKYQLEQLKQLCSSPLAKSINSDNVIDLLVKSHILQVQSLKKHCIDFILMADPSKFMQRDDWKTKIEQRYPELYKDMMKELFCGPPVPKKPKLHK